MLKKSTTSQITLQGKSNDIKVCISIFTPQDSFAIYKHIYIIRIVILPLKLKKENILTEVPVYHILNI